MTELLIVALVVAVYVARRYRDERDALATELLALRLEHRQDHLDAELGVWRQTAAVHHAARQAMHDVVASVPPERPVATTVRPAKRQPPRLPVMPPYGLSADEVNRLVNRRPR